MPNRTNRNSRSNMRNNRYSLLDDFAARQRQTAAGVAWRWRTELAIILGLAGGLADAQRAHLLIITAACLAATLVILAALPWTRRFFTRRAWCVLARHRIQKVCWEARLHTRSGRLPLILWTRPTQVGERLWLVCRAGICAQDFTDNQAELAAGCFAREARITASPRWSHLITIDIIRRDTLAAKHTVLSPLARPARPASRGGEAA